MRLLQLSDEISMTAHLSMRSESDENIYLFLLSKEHVVEFDDKKRRVKNE